MSKLVCILPLLVAPSPATSPVAAPAKRAEPGASRKPLPRKARLRPHPAAKPTAHNSAARVRAEIYLGEPKRFVGPKKRAVDVPAGHYRVMESGKGRLTLMALDGGRVVLAARRVAHTEKVAADTSLLVSMPKGRVAVVLLRKGGIGWQAVGGPPSADPRALSRTRVDPTEVGTALQRRSRGAAWVVSPRGGTVAKPGRTISIQWGTQGEKTAAVDVVLLREGRPVRDLFRSTANDGSATWRPDKNLLPGTYSLLIQSTDGTLLAHSDEFSVETQVAPLTSTQVKTLSTLHTKQVAERALLPESVLNTASIQTWTPPLGGQPAAPKGPDLMIEISLNPEKYVVRNIGDQDAVFADKASFIEPSNYYYPQDYQAPAGAVIPAGAARDARVHYFVWRCPDTAYGAQQFASQPEAIVDPDNAIAESDETNNSVVVVRDNPIRLPAGTDLSNADLVISEVVTAGSVVTPILKNVGTTYYYSCRDFYGPHIMVDVELDGQEYSSRGVRPPAGTGTAGAALAPGDTLSHGYGFLIDTTPDDWGVAPVSAGCHDLAFEIDWRFWGTQPIPEVDTSNNRFETKMNVAADGQITVGPSAC